MFEILVLLSCGFSLVLSTLCLRSAATSEGWMWPSVAATVGGLLMFWAGYCASIMTSEFVLEYVFLIWLD